MFYDFLLTFEHERDLVWRGGMRRCTTLMVLINRLSMLLWTVDLIVYNAGPTVRQLCT